MRGKLATIVLSAGLLWLLGSPPVQAALVVNGPDQVLMVDGSDPGSTVKLFSITLTGLPANYDFGFMNGQTFVPIALTSKGPIMFYGTYTFGGGSLVNFALRYDPTGTIYTMSDPADSVAQIYTGPIAASHSSDPLVGSPYYRTLTMDWKLNANGFDSPGTKGLIITLRSLNRFDGMTPDAAPVKLPAAVTLFGSGLAGLLAWRRMMV